MSNDEQIETMAIRALLANPSISKELFEEMLRRLDVLEKRSQASGTKPVAPQ